jgi:hypothetical protein
LSFAKGFALALSLPGTAAGNVTMREPTIGYKETQDV